MKSFVFGGIGTFLSVESINPENFGSIEDLISYIVSIFGGLLVAVIMRFLERKFPEYFARVKPKPKPRKQ